MLKGLDFPLPGARRFPGPTEPLGARGRHGKKGAPPEPDCATPACHPPSVSMNVSTAAVGDAQVAVAENASRRTLSIQNQSSTEALRVSTQGPAATSAAVQIAPGALWEPYVAPRNALFIAPAGSTAIDYLLIEG